MSGTQKGLIGLFLLVPFVLVFAVFPRLAGFMGGGEAPELTPEVGGVMAVPPISPLPVTPTAAADPARPTATSIPRSDTVPTATPLPAATPVPGTTAVPGSPTPEDAVRAFYGLVEAREYGAAALMWSARMRAEYPPVANIHRRFTNTRTIDVTRAERVSLDEGAGTAEVSVDLTEVTSGGTQQLSGSWRLVRGSAGWLLDQPSF